MTDKAPRVTPKRTDVIVVPIQQPEVTESGLYIAKRKNERIVQGIVAAIGAGVTEDIETGDHVVFLGYTGDKISLEGPSGGIYFVVPETHITAKIKPAGARLVDTESMKRLIRERASEIRGRGYGDEDGTMSMLERDILDRIDTFVTSEGFEF